MRASQSEGASENERPEYAVTMYQAPVTEQALPHSSESFRSVSVSSQQKKHQKRQVKKQKRKKKRERNRKQVPAAALDSAGDTPDEAHEVLTAA